MQAIKLDWQDPLKLAGTIATHYSNNDWIFLYSGLHEQVPHSISQIALFPRNSIISDDFNDIKTRIHNSENKWFGYLSYEVGQHFENLKKTTKSIINTPKIHLIDFALIFEFDHDQESLTAYYDDEKLLQTVRNYPAAKTLPNSIAVADIHSNFSNDSYLAAIADIKNRIANGDFYQTNLTRKFFGHFQAQHNSQTAFDLFAKLCQLSPANYSSFLQLGENHIISSSPELFLKSDKGEITSLPIKGTAPRHHDPIKDHKNKLALQHSSKEQAENLMIVDLVRNDLSRVCKAGSVKVDKLFNITSYENIHHMSSRITGHLNHDATPLDVIATSFPPGSMTGAPKIKAMEVAAQKEQYDRGIYSGAIGYLGRDALHLSVVIRTLILHQDQFEFQVGGAITFESDPQMELDETFNKAKGILNLLQIDQNNLSDITK